MHLGFWILGDFTWLWKCGLQCVVTPYSVEKLVPLDVTEAIMLAHSVNMCVHACMYAWQAIVHDPVTLVTLCVISLQAQVSRSKQRIVLVSVSFRPKTAIWKKRIHFEMLRHASYLPRPPLLQAANWKLCEGFFKSRLFQPFLVAKGFGDVTEIWC